MTVVVDPADYALVLDEIRATYPLQRVTLERIAARHRSRIGASS